MIRFTAKAISALALSASLSIALAATSAIGVVTSNGNILLNDARTAANATVFDGSTIQTETSAGQVRMTNGSRVQLGADSRGKFYADRIVLEKGAARVEGYTANANGLKIQPDAKGSATVMLKGGTVEVASIAGTVHVYNAYGVNVANLAPGKALDLTPQDAGASGMTTVIGTVKKDGAKMMITDETSNTTFELKGFTNLKVGSRVQVSGTVSGNVLTAGSTKTAKILGAAGAAGAAGAGAAAAGGAAAGAAGAGAAAAGAAAAGISATTAVVAGVAAAAVVGIAAGVSATSGGTSTSGTTLSAGKTN